MSPVNQINRDPKLIDPILLNFYTELSILLKSNHKKDFRIFEGHRTLDRQKMLKSQGFSKTLKSKHLFLPSKAIDVIEYPWKWDGFIQTAEYKKIIIDILKKYPSIKWGGLWKTFIDIPHFEI